MCTPHQEQGTASAPPAASTDINLNLFQHFLSSLKLPDIFPPPEIAKGPTEYIMEDIYAMCREEIDIHLKIYGLNAGDEASLPPYLIWLIGKHVSKSIQDNIMTSQVRNTYY